VHGNNAQHLASPEGLLKIYSLSIARMHLALRIYLMALSALPIIPFTLIIQHHFTRVSSGSTLLAMLCATIIFVPAHELAHGLVFWLYARRVSFGFKPWSAVGPVFYAASVGSIFSVRQYQMACLAPQFLTVALWFAAALSLPDVIKIGTAYAAALNLGGGAMDIYVCYVLARFRKEAIVEDTREGTEVYLPSSLT
jgi:hypothetical protein